MTNVVRELKIMGAGALALLSGWLALWAILYSVALPSLKDANHWMFFVTIPLGVVFARISYISCHWAKKNWKLR
ncbi:hypothetical protein [Pseudomonas phage D6]|nr:hypothetical protein [Pseudomonas phage D6]